MRLSSAVQQFIEEARPSKSPETIRAYQTDLGLLVSLASIASKDNILGFDHTLCLAYVAALAKKGLSLGTQRRRRCTLSAFGRWGVRRRLWTANPVEMTDPILRERKLPRPFRPDERVRLMGLALNPREHVLRALLYWTGLRITPICQIRIGDISFAPVRFTEELQMPGSIRTMGKGRKEFVLGMHPKLRPILEDYILQHHPDLDPTSRLILLGSGRPLSSLTAERWVRRWGQQATVFGGCTPHRFRHTFPTALIESGVDIRVIQVLMNHQNLSTTAIYTQVANKQAFEGLLKMPDYSPQPQQPAAPTHDEYTSDTKHGSTSDGGGAI